MSDKSLFQIPRWERSEEVALNVPPAETLNVNGVPAKRWTRWTPEARALFNHLYASGMSNPDAVFCVYKFDYGADQDAIMNAVSWNLAWLAADKLSGL